MNSAFGSGLEGRNVHNTVNIVPIDQPPNGRNEVQLRRRMAEGDAASGMARLNGLGTLHGSVDSATA
jgi:hypothetical protein